MSREPWFASRTPWGYKSSPAVMREHSERPGDWRLICRANPREEEAWVRDTSEELAEVNCEKCLAILHREARAAA